MKRAGLLLHPRREEAAEVGRWLAATLGASGVEVHALPADAQRIGEQATGDPEGFPDGCDLLFSLGGDGTLLRAAELAYAADVPLLGVNLGRLGFLAELERADLAGALEQIVSRGFDVEERMVIEGEVVGGGPVWALNDVIIAKMSIGRAIKLAVSIGGEPVVAFAADGLIVATPTGSTAYSFSAHGPLVSPRIDCLIVTPVSAHDLFDRTLIASASEGVDVRVLPDPDGASLSADGRPGVELPQGAEVRLRAGRRRLRLAKVSPSPFWRLLRSKLRLPTEPRASDPSGAGER